MRVLTFYYADTRPHFQKHWQYNAEIVKHNYETIMRKPLRNWEFEHHMFIHQRGTWPPAMQELAESLPESHNVTVHVTDPPRLKHMFNSVQLDSYRRLGLKHIQTFDRILHVQHDSILICQCDCGAPEIMEEIIMGISPALAYYPSSGPYDYVSHWIARTDQLSLFQHVAAVGIGYLRASKAHLVMQCNEQDEKHGEHRLYDTGERCLYMRPNPLLYFGDYCVSHLNPTRLHDLLRCATSLEAFQEIIDTAGRHVRGSLHPFMSKRIPTEEDNR